MLFLSCFVFYEIKKVIKFFLKIATFFKKKPNFEKQTCQKLDSFVFSSPTYFIFLSKKRQSVIGLWNQLKEHAGNSNFALLNQKKNT